MATCRELEEGEFLLWVEDVSLEGVPEVGLDKRGVFGALTEGNGLR